LFQPGGGGAVVPELKPGVIGAPPGSAQR